MPEVLKGHVARRSCRVTGGGGGQVHLRTCPHKDKVMLKSELIEKLLEIPYDGEVELLVQTVIDNAYYNVIAEQVLSVEEEGSTVIIRGQDTSYV